MSAYIISFLLILLGAAAQGDRDLTNEEYYSLPTAFHLDDYPKCTNVQDGIYCVGRFVLQPLNENNQKYELMQALSEKHTNYNHSLTYQGLCLTSTCAHIKHHNYTYRFERCVDEWASTYHMTASFNKFYYCHTRYDITKPPEVDTPKLVFLVVTGIIVSLNIIGTLHDYNTRSDEKKRNKFYLAWSVPANWDRIVTPFNFKDPRMQNLEAIQGLRVLMMFKVMVAHISIICYGQGSLDLRYLEQLHRSFLGIYVRGMLSTVQVNFTVASFLLTYFFLLSGKSLKLSEVPENIIKRLIRTLPVTIYLVAFAATWWVDLSHSPTWPAVVATESHVCRGKFWLQLFYLNNLFSVDDTCLIQSWFPAADLQLYIVLLLILVFISYCQFSRETCISITTGLIAAAVALVYILGYHFEWRPMQYVATPENLIRLFSGETTFARYYIAPWGSLVAVLTGMLVAYLLHHVQQKQYQLEQQKWFVFLYNASVPMIFYIWPLFGMTHESPFQSPHAVATYMVAERGITTLFAAILILGLSYGIESPVRSLFSWKCWQPVGRLSLAYMMVHWCVLAYYSVGKPMPLVTFSSFVSEGAGCFALSILFALPVALFLEIPMSRFLTVVFFKNDKKLI